MIRFFSIIIASLYVSAIYAQIPAADDLREIDSLQRRDLSMAGSRIIINPFNFNTDSRVVTALSYSAGTEQTLPLNVGYLTIDTDTTAKPKRFGRVFTDLLKIHKPAPNGRDTIQCVSLNTEWLPYALPFNVTYADGLSLSGYDFLYDENTIARVINFPFRGKFIISGVLKNEVKAEKRSNILIVRSKTCKYAIAFHGVGNSIFNRIQIDDNQWTAEISGTNKVTVTVTFALLNESDETFLARVRAVKNIDRAYTARINYYNDFLKNRIPHPINFDINNVDAKGVTPDDIRLTYYKAWVFLDQDVLPPEGERYPYYQIATGKPSLWDEGHPLAPFSASWESFIGIQLYAFINPDISWSSLKGLMSLVDADGMLGGESLPSRKAHTAWLLYKLTGDKQSLSEIYAATERYLLWRMKNPRWIYGNHDNKDEKDVEFSVSVCVDMGYMIEIAKALDMPDAAKKWESERTGFIEQCIKWFWSTPQEIPTSHPNERPRQGTAIMITTAMMLPEIKGDYFDGLLGKFYTYYETDKTFGGFPAPKYPDMDFTIYGLLQNGKYLLARNMIECNLRDVVRAQRVFAEAYRAITPTPEGVRPRMVSDTPFPNGVRPSLFGVATIIDFVLLKNGYMYREAKPSPYNMYPDEKTGVRHDSSTSDYATEVAGEYFGDGKLWSPGDITDVAITLKYVDKETVNATIQSVLPAALQALGGKKTMTGVLKVSSDYTLSGKIKLMIFNFDATGSVDPETHTVALNIPGNVMGHALNFELTGRFGEPPPSAPDYAADIIGSYYGAGSMTGTLSGDISEAEIHLTNVNNSTVATFIEVAFPATLQEIGGLQNMRGNLMVSPDYEITGTVLLMRVHQLAVTGSVDTTNHTITLNLSGIVAGNTLNLYLNMKLET